MMKHNHNDRNHHRQTAARRLLLAASMALLAGCGEYFAPDIPEEYDPEVLPTITHVAVDGSYLLHVGDKVQLRTSDLTIDNGLSFDLQSSDQQQYLLNSMVWSAGHGDTIVKARAADLSITAMARGTDQITFFNATDTIGTCRIRVVDGTEPPTAIHTDRVAITLLEGMTWTPALTFEPDYCSNLNVTWESGNTDVATVIGSGQITAVRTGTTTITVTAADDATVQAQIIVTVLPDWTRQRVGRWRYETIVYAKILVDDTDVTSSYNISVAALFADGTCHGRSEILSWNSKSYRAFRVGSNAVPGSGEVIHFTGYDTDRLVAIDFTETLDFDGQVHGTLSAPLILHGNSSE